MDFCGDGNWFFCVCVSWVGLCGCVVMVVGVVVLKILCFCGCWIILCDVVVFDLCVIWYVMRLGVFGWWLFGLVGLFLCVLVVGL